MKSQSQITWFGFYQVNPFILRLFLFWIAIFVLCWKFVCSMKKHFQKREEIKRLMQVKILNSLSRNIFIFQFQWNIRLVQDNFSYYKPFFFHLLEEKKIVPSLKLQPCVITWEIWLVPQNIHHKHIHVVITSFLIQYTQTLHSTHGAILKIALQCIPLLLVEANKERWKKIRSMHRTRDDNTHAHTHTQRKRVKYSSCSTTDCRQNEIKWNINKI